jgi:hypothetical protein
MEGVYSRQLMTNRRFQRGTVDQIHEMGLVQKDGFKYAKVSVDRLACVFIDGVNEIILTKYKSRVNPDRAHKEED